MTPKRLDRQNEAFAARFLEGWGDAHDFSTETEYGWTVGEMNYQRHKALYLDNELDVAADFEDRIRYAGGRVY